MKRKIYIALLLLYMLAIFCVSSIPAGHKPEDKRTSFDRALETLQNLAHIPAYGLLAFLIVHALARDSDTLISSIYPYIVAFTIAAAYSVLDEWHQSYVPGRYATAGDVGSDICGAAFALVILKIYYGKKAGAQGSGGAGEQGS